MFRPLTLKATLFTSSCLISLAPTWAVENINTTIDEEFVVVAARREQPVSEVAKSISVLSQDALIDRQYSFVLDALQSLPGLTINQNGSFGGVATVSIRGAGTDQTVVLLDGIQINDPSSTGGAFNFASLDPNGVERIEVLRGPQAVLYGSDAMGGVINIITRSGGDGTQGSVYGEYGAFDSLRLGGSVSAGDENLNGHLSASYINTDGISTADVADGNSETDGYESYTLRGKLGGTVSETIRLELAGNYTDTTSEFDGFSLQPDGSYGLGDSDDLSKTKEFSIAGRSFFSFFDDRLESIVSVEYSSIDRKNFNGGVSSYFAEGERLNFDLINSLAANENWTVTAGLQHEETKAASVDPQTISIDSIFGLLSYTGIKGLTLSGGLRLDDHETFGSSTNGEANASYTLSETGTRFTAAWSEGFKAPSIFQLTYACCGFEANPDIAPERSKAWEAGISQPLFNDNVIVAATYFNQKTRDLIGFTFTAGYQNIARAKAEGVELTLKATISDTVSLSGNYTYTSSKDRDTGLQLARRPKNHAFATLAWQPVPRLKTNLSVTYNGSEVDGVNRAPDWTRVDLRASYQVSDHVEIYGRIDNLFDENYQQVLGYGTPGISSFFGIRVKH